MSVTTDVNEADAGPASGSNLLELRSITKTFGAVAALTEVDLDVAAGQVVALVGDNGAGKSTLAKILSGVYPPDSGTISFASEEVTIPSPAAAHNLGIATVFQDLALCENLNVIENLFLGQEIRPLRLDDVAMETQSWALLRQLSARCRPCASRWRRSPAGSARPSPSPARCSATPR